MSQSEFAAAIRHAGDALGEPNTANKRLVQKWESGEHAHCRPHYRRALQSVTRMPFDQLGFRLAGDDASARPSKAVGSPFENRDLVRGESLASVGEPCERLRFALERPGQADLEEIALVETATTQLFDLEHHRPARLLLPAARRHLEDVSALLSGTRRETLRRRLALTGGRTAALIGWLMFDLGDADFTFRYWDAALAAARHAGDGPLLACVLTYQSYAAAERGDPATAWQLAHSAVAHAGPDPRARSWMAARAAEEAARLGEHRAALAELDLAMQLGSTLTTPAPDEPSMPWTRFFYRAMLGAIAANVHGRLGNIPQARDAAAWALRTLTSERVKARALVLAEVACAYARAGEIEIAVESAHQAADLTEQLEITLAYRRLRTLIPMLSPYSTSAAVRELFTRLSSDLPQTR
ncbi:MAG TPA: hypothetical protein VGZ32_03405 [Actinocrinis sp.]|jgi:hypothetical protein|uniref:hypothetical protein n=1 Tax=Actinocrinis sp. TaxID=1920516 RepID=UPI002DDCB895|nr:hypothetical protein [Actinocrinis sp.]HEV3169353.1 hypothetical protein [Actinocrinis sp.]